MTDRRRRRRRGFYETYVKRPADIVGAAVGLAVSAPIMLAVAAAIRTTMGRPVLFRQVRPGMDEKLFTLVKFRTMSEHQADDNGHDLPDEVRITPAGRVLRKTSLDELPQMVNVLRGEMSFIGPRPLTTEYLGHYHPEERARHRVRPGMTGLAQVSGRADITTWEERFEYDLKYVENVTFANDLRILGRTIAVVFAGTGVEASDLPDFDVYRREMA
ncbi:MAG TPA: sugar transferase [Actinomycetaceae bacterium]|nr:sugar transferase [Actinomycetaceae bacterium]